jgi:hypothetical protein
VLFGESDPIAHIATLNFLLALFQRLFAGFSKSLN